MINVGQKNLCGGYLSAGTRISAPGLEVCNLFSLALFFFLSFGLFGTDSYLDY